MIFGALGLAGWTTALTLAPSEVHAQQSDDERARSHFMAARSYADQARWDDAVAQFEEAYRLSRRPEMLLNIATMHERAQRPHDAADAIQRYLDASPDAPDRVTLESRIASLRALPQASVAATTPAEPETTTATETAPTSTPAAAEGGGLHTLGTVGLVVAGVGVAAGIASLATGLAAHDAYGQLEANCPGGVCPPSEYGTLDSGSSLATASTALLIGAGVAAAAGVTLLAIDLASGPSASEHARIEILPAPGGVVVTGSF